VPGLKGTKTEANLKEAFAGESQANRRYLYFAQKADVEGYPDVAALFRSVAEGETGHAFGHFDFLKEVGDPVTGVPVGSTEDNLKSAIEGETYEYTEMYPGFARTARDEGFEEVAEWLNSIGVTGIILKYRCPRRPGDVKGEPPIGPLKDAQRAVSLVRSKAREWGLDPKRIGMIGFSAGGHLVGATATNFGKRSYEPIDDVDKISCRPDFGIMLYSGYFKVKDKEELSPTIRVAADAPPLFLVHATDDPISEVDHSVITYLAMKRGGVSAELHVYATGGHGFAVRKVDHPCSAWTRSCIDWLRSRGMLEKSPSP